MFTGQALRGDPLAEAATAPEPQTAAPQPAPILSSFDGLDAAMAAARQTAAAAESTNGTVSDAPEGAAAVPPPATQTTPAPPASDDDAQEGEDEGLAPPTADPNLPVKPSRMGRLREQLTQADQRAREAEAKMNERLGADFKVRQKYAALLGTDQEKAQLEAVLANQASPTFEVNQARTRLAQMHQAREELTPLYTAVEQDVFAGFVRGLEQLRTLDGMTDDQHQALYKAPNGVEALKLMHSIGQKAAADDAKGEIASLKAQVSALQTKLAANGRQPAPGGGLTPGGSTQLAGLLGADGLPTEEAIARAKAGGLRSLGQPATA